MTVCADIATAEFGWPVGMPTENRTLAMTLTVVRRFQQHNC
jgi:hypothetical protein